MMKWPLLGIITIILLQSFFTAYNALNRPIESLIAVNEITNGSNPIANVLDQYDASNASTSQSFKNRNKDHSGFSFVNVRNHVRPTVAVSSVYTKSRKSYSTKRISALVAMQKPFEAVTITYPQPTRTGRETEDYSVQAVRFAENRSFLSKSASVIKKPFKWVKALGSKLR